MQLVVAHQDAAYAAAIGGALRRRGCAVHLARCGSEARQLAWALAPSLVLLDTELRPESGWLTCSKLLGEWPELKVVLLRRTPSPEHRRFAQFVGAASLLDQEQNLEALIGELEDRSLLAIRGAPA